MATYGQIQNYIKNKYGYTVKTCWIAHVKEMSGLDVDVAPNRNDIKEREYPCPEDKVEPIKDAFRHFGMI
jgi:hypothetical protein